MGGNMNDVIETPMKSQGVNLPVRKVEAKGKFSKAYKG